MGRKALDSRSVYFSASPLPQEPAAGGESACAPRSLRGAIGRLRGGDQLVVQRLEDLGDDLTAILEAVEGLHRRRVHLKILQDGLDSAARGMADVLHGLRLAAELERRRRATAWKREIEEVREHGAFRPGRPRRLTLDEVAALRAEGCGAAEIARRLKVSRWTVYRTLKQLETA